VRQVHKDVQSGLDAFVGALQPWDLPWSVIGFIADASNSGDLTNMLEAAIALVPGQSAETAGKWCVRAVAVERSEEVVGGNSEELFRPEWWPTGEPNYSSVNRLLAPPGNVVLVRSLVPHVSYINPIRSKADGGQRQLGKPYLIALDVRDLRRAHERIVPELGGYLEIWDHVSAVLLFEPRFWTGVDSKRWVVSMHRNSAATIALPSDLAALSDRGEFPIDFILTRRAENGVQA
jgi:hypothetical protein